MCHVRTVYVVTFITRHWFIKRPPAASVVFQQLSKPLLLPTVLCWLSFSLGVLSNAQAIKLLPQSIERSIAIGVRSNLRILKSKAKCQGKEIWSLRSISVRPTVGLPSLLWMPSKRAIFVYFVAGGEDKDLAFSKPQHASYSHPKETFTNLDMQL